MRLQSVHLRNYRRYVDFDVEFSAQFSVIVGINGSGKSSLLSGICEALNGALVNSGVPFQPPLKESRVVRVEAVEVEGRTRFESRFPVVVTATAIQFGMNQEWSVSRAQSAAQGEFGATCFGVASNFQAQLNAFPLGDPLPLFAYYRADRQWMDAPVSAMAAVIRKESRSDAYISWMDASRDASSLQLWLVSKYLERLQATNDASIPFGAVGDDELSAVNTALASVVENAKAFRYDIKAHTLLIEWIDRGPSPFENLSDGQKSVICLVADIARRMCLLNPQLGSKVLSDTPGVILIDELDMHLHPAWQRMIVRGLKAAFPSAQFIVASHSPQILSELEPEEIIVMEKNQTSHPQVSYGVDVGRVLESIMGATSRPEAVQTALDEIFDLLERGALDEARARIRSLREAAPGIADLERAEALLRRKEILGK